MLCSHCKKRNAAFHYKEIINGEMHEIYLCPQCANTLGYSESFHDSFDFGSILNEFLGIGMSQAHTQSIQVCPQCGTDFESFRKTGLIGCEKCYEKFDSKIESMLSSIQSGTTHKGKTASKEDNKKREKEEKILRLKADLKEKISEEKYEEAAKIRDEIKALEGKTNE